MSPVGHRVDASNLPTVIMVLGLALAFISLFLPWVGFGFDCSSTSGLPNLSCSVNENGFHDWGIVYCGLWLGLSFLLLARNFGGSAVRIGALPIDDWLLYIGGAALVALVVIIFWFSLPSELGVYPGFAIRFGWWVALLAAALVAIGGFMLRPPRADFSVKGGDDGTGD